METLAARQITAVIRKLFPHVNPLTTKTDLSSNGLLLSFTVTMPEPAAQHWGVAGGGRTGHASAYLSRCLGTDVRITNVYSTRRTSGGKLAHLVIEKGTRR